MMSRKFTVTRALKVLLVVVLFCALFCETTVTAATLPTVKQHSKTDIGLYQGDGLKLSVDAEGTDLRYRWVRADATLCREAVCEVSTKEWSTGSHLVVLIVYNAEGSTFVRFRINLLARTPEHVTETVTPDKVAASNDVQDRIGRDDMAISAVLGRGYSYHESKIQIVGKLPRPLEWKEKLKTNTLGVLQIRSPFEEHFVLPNTTVALAKTDFGRRGVVLLSGTVRSRSLVKRETPWSVVVGSWLQVDTDPAGDVIVERDPKNLDQAKVTVLRGNARVYVRQKDEPEDKGVPARSINLPTGVMASFVKGSLEVESYLKPHAGTIDRIVQMTTPQYFIGEAGNTARESAPRLLAKAPESRAEALKRAQEALRVKDYPVALEALVGQLESGSTPDSSYEYQLALGLAYKGLFAYEEARKYLIAAHKVNAEEAVATFALGEMDIAENQWEDARKSFSEVDESLVASPQAYHYYAGVADYRLGQFLPARNHFIMSLWSDEESEDLSESAREFLSLIKDVKKFNAHVGAKLFYDSNVFRVSTSTSPPNGIEPRTGLGWAIDGAIDWTAFRFKTASFNVWANGAMYSYLSSDLKNVGGLDENFGFTVRNGFGASSDGQSEGKVVVGLKPYVGMYYIGPNRVRDTLAYEVEIGAPMFKYRPWLTIGTGLRLDPLPGSDDLLDPTIWEVIAPSERSSRFFEYDLGLLVKDDAHHYWKVDGIFNKTIYRNEIVANDNYSEFGVKSAYNYAFSIRNHAETKFGFLSRSFAEATDSRKDSKIDLGLGWRWHYRPSLYQLTTFDYATQSSTRTENKYSRMVVGTGVGLDL